MSGLGKNIADQIKKSREARGLDPNPSSTIMDPEDEEEKKKKNKWWSKIKNVLGYTSDDQSQDQSA